MILLRLSFLKLSSFRNFILATPYITTSIPTVSLEFLVYWRALVCVLRFHSYNILFFVLTSLNYKPKYDHAEHSSEDYRSGSFPLL